MSEGTISMNPNPSRLTTNEEGSERLRFLVSVNPRKSEISDWPADTMVSFVPMGSLGIGGGIDLDQECRMDEVYEGYTYFREGDVLLAKITPCFENGKVAIAEGLKNGVGFGTTELYVLRPMKDLLTRYLFYLVRSSYFRENGKAHMQGVAGQKRLKEDFVKDFRIKIPSPDRQLEITEFLDSRINRIDGLVTSKYKQIALLREKLLSFINHAVTRGLDSTTQLNKTGLAFMDKIPSHWEISSLKWYVDKIGSGITPRGGGEVYVSDGIPFLRSQNVHFDGLRLDDVVYIDEETHSAMARSELQPGDVLLNITGASLGRTALVPDDFPRGNVNQHVCIIRPSEEEMLSQYLHGVIASRCVQYQIFSEQEGASREAVTFEEIGNFKVPVPPIDEQREIAESIADEASRIHHLIAQIERSINTLDEYRNALITAVITGKVDISEKVKHHAEATH